MSLNFLQLGWFFDSSSSLNLMGSATLVLKKRVGPGSGRPEVPKSLVQTERAIRENDWVGKSLRIGTAGAFVKRTTDALSSLGE